jgi:signal transduction histidine kinase
MSLVSVILYVIATFAGVLGLLVFLRNSQSRSHRLFLSLSLNIGFWIVSNAYFAQTTSDMVAYLVALLSYAFAAATAVSFFFFVVDLSDTKLRLLTFLRWLSVFFVLASPIPGFLATGVQNQAIRTTPFILLYAAGLAGLFIAGIGILIRGRRHSRGQRKQQLGAVLAGLIGGIIGGVFFNLLLPIQGDYRFVQLGPAFSILFVITSAYAIVRHRLFDLRAAIVRVAAYSLAVLTVAVLYVVVAFVVAAPLFGGQAVEGNVQLVYISLAVLTALTFQPVKKFFDTATRAVFYKNAYNTQQVLDELGTLLVSEVDVVKLLRDSMQLLGNAIRPASSEVVLVKDHTQARVVAAGAPLKGTDELIKHIRNKHVGLTVTDDLAEHGGPLYQELSGAGVAVAMPLVTSKATVGYLLVGYKSSGNAFGQQDIDLVRIFADELAVAVQNALRFEEISHFNVTLKEEVDDATHQLRASNRKLHKLDEAKDEFISMASHQLRTPLTSVKGYLSMVLEEDAGKITPDQRKLLQEAYDSSQRMVYLIGDFLNVSRLQTDKFMLELAPVNLAHLVREEVDQLMATATRREIKLEYHEPAQFPEIPLDDGKMRQVVMNFIDNAIYYSKPNSVVLIELTATSKDITLTVHDTGIGVPASERPHVFTKFYRATNARKVRPDGTGIGLYMTKKVVVAHGGSIIFETRENKGSTFGFRVPVKS